MTLVQASAFDLPYPDKYFHACVTSPPYWGLRKYAGEQGDEPLGLEATPERHIERMVAVFREVRRVLRDDGVVWLNYGDCYGGSWGNYGSRNGGQRSVNVEKLDRNGKPPDDYRPPTSNQTSGNLMLMPHRLAIALQDDGWIVRNDLVWYKRNPMPESVAGWRWERSRKEKKRIKGGGAQNTNLASMEAGISGGLDKVEWEYGDDYVLRKSSWRHTRAHEYVFQLVKGMSYYCNQEVVREGLAESSIERIEYGWDLDPDHPQYDPNKTTERMGERYAPSSGRNPRSVLDVPTAPYKGSHYATFPPNLIAPLIRASVPRRCCPECGQAWAPVVEKSGVTQHGQERKRADAPGAEVSPSSVFRTGEIPVNSVTAYRPTCDHDAEPVPGRVLDIFGGSGTTGMVAKELMRKWVVMDISRPYLDEQAKVRTGTGTPSIAMEGLPLFEEASGER